MTKQPLFLSSPPLPLSLPRSLFDRNSSFHSFIRLTPLSLPARQALLLSLTHRPFLLLSLTHRPFPPILSLTHRPFPRYFRTVARFSSKVPDSLTRTISPIFFNQSPFRFLARYLDLCLEGPPITTNALFLSSFTFLSPSQPSRNLFPINATLITFLSFQPDLRPHATKSPGSCLGV